MPYLNKVMIIGHVGRDAEVRYLASGTAVANFSVATTEKWKDKATGEKKERTEWHNVVVWGKTVDYCEKYLVKGVTVYVEGSLRTSEWEDQNGQKRTKTEINATDVKIFKQNDNQGRPRGIEKLKDFDDITF